MPGVAVLPNSPGLAGFGAPQLANMPTLFHDGPQTSPTSVTQNKPDTQASVLDPVVIKARVTKNLRSTIQRKSVASSALLNSAKKQYDEGRESESKNDLVGAYESFVMAARLMTEVLSRSDSGSLWNDIENFSKTDLGDRLKSVEEKLTALNSQQPSSGREVTVGTTIADRKKALEDNGMSLGNGVATKRMSRTLSEVPPSSPKPPSIRLSTLTPTPQTSSLPISTPPPPSPRSLVSPSSSPPTSPTTSFSQSFPTIEEIEATAHPVPVDHSKSFHNGTSLATQIEGSPSVLNPPTTNSILGQPGSLMEPFLSHKPSLSSMFSSSTISQAPRHKPPIPISGTINPAELSELADDYVILLLDVRSRSDFKSGSVELQGAAKACIEPSWLRNENLTLPELDQAMMNAPSPERSVFGNREKFDIVVLYDNASYNLGAGNTPLSRLNFLLVQNKVLKRSPILLTGGFKEWRRHSQALSDVSSTVSSDAAPPIGSPPISRLNSNNPFRMNGFASAPISSPGFPSAQVASSSSPFHHFNLSLDYGPGHSRYPAEAAYPTSIPPLNAELARRPVIARHSSTSSYMTGSSDNVPNSPSSYSSSFSSGFTYPILTPIPSAAPIKPSQLSRKRTDYDDPSQDAISDLRIRTQIAYPALSNLQPPPPVASSALERQDTRPRPPSAPVSLAVPRALRNQTPVFHVNYWSGSSSPVCGLNNLGNTCYMNATLQCLYATVPFMSFFKDYPWEPSINMLNVLGTKGKVTKAFEQLLKDMWERKSNISHRLQVCLAVVRSYDRQYEGHNQHDSQEFLTFLLDKIHEDLNRVLAKPVEPRLTPEQELALEMRDPRRAIDEEWDKWRSSNDSIIVDLFQGQFKNLLQCTVCRRVRGDLSCLPQTDV
ncbi:hypothetical protein C0991_000528 [Blastosporella zonata]|nr:hypothetical protein C0991_000528 [Blastosporella zonata]